MVASSIVADIVQQFCILTFSNSVENLSGWNYSSQHVHVDYRSIDHTLNRQTNMQYILCHYRILQDDSSPGVRLEIPDVWFWGKGCD